MTKKVLIIFPREKVSHPLLYDLIKKFDLVINIFRAKIDPNDIGYAVVDLTSSIENVEAGIEYIRSLGMQVNDKMTGLKWDNEKCVSCGACLSHCPTNALHIDNRNTMEIVFDDESCVECLNCIDHCPFGACSSIFEK